MSVTRTKAAIFADIERRGTYFDKLPSTLTFKAWKSTQGGQGYDRFEASPVDLPENIETIEQAAQASCNCLTHKESIIVLKRDEALRPERRNLVSIFYVRKRSNRAYIRGPEGKPVREPEFYPELVSQFCVADGFDPVEPWRLTRDSTTADIIGADTTLIEGSVK